MEKAKVRSVLPTATERIMSVIVSKARKHVKGLTIEKAIKMLIYMGYPVDESIRLAFMVRWNKKNNKRLLTLPLFTHTIHYVKYNEGSMVDVYRKIYVSTSKIAQKQFNDVERNKQNNNYQATLDELLENKKLFSIGESRLSYCLDNTYGYKKNEIVEIKTIQIL